jgi:uncharacterized protein YjiS (DUF1127 family)
MHTILGANRSAAGTVGHKEPASRFATIVVGAMWGLIGWAERARQRRALLSLDDWMLKDIGLSRADVMREYDKPVWRE